jgi:DNA polymerase-3 subunit epsilon
VAAAEILARGTGVRTCTARLSRTARHTCEHHELAPCPAPRGTDAAGYAPAPQGAAALIAGADSSAFGTVLGQIEALAAAHRYESAARLRDHTADAIDVVCRGQRLQALADVEELVAARPDGRGGWELAVVRHGQLASAGCARRGVPPMPVVDAICAAAQTILPEPAPLGGALVEETGLIARWLAGPGVRIVRAERGYASPIGSAARWAGWAAHARSARLAAQQHDGTDLTDDRYGIDPPTRKSFALRLSG